MIRNDRYPHVFQPLTIRGVTLKNRLEYAPTVVLKCSPEGEVTQEMLDYVAWQAKTGVGYLTIGNTPVVHTDSSAWVCELNVTQDRCIHGLEMMARTARENGAEMSVELAHAGRGSNSTPGNPALAPSDVPLNGGPLGYIKPMNEEDMAFVRQQFVDCAIRCQKAGLKIIMIHCAHNNLLAQFLSPASNHRTDAYGGSLENRMRFPLSVLKAVREAVPNMVIECRCSAQEDTPDGLQLEESLMFMERAQAYVDIIHVAVVGNITSLKEAEDIIGSGKADIVVMAKSYMADENLIHKSIRGHAEDVRPCTRCDWCGNANNFGTSMRCAINPMLGRDIDLSKLVEPGHEKHVMVIGGGPGGMMAAQTLCAMGHRVSLYEKSHQLGGLLNDATVASFKEYMRLYLQWDIRQTMQCGAEIHLDTEVTPELVEQVNPDAVIVASGSTYVHPNIPGIDMDKVKTVSDVENHRAWKASRLRSLTRFPWRSLQTACRCSTTLS